MRAIPSCSLVMVDARAGGLSCGHGTASSFTGEVPSCSADIADTYRCRLPGLSTGRAVPLTG
jgi:hypothetical protein